MCVWGANVRKITEGKSEPRWQAVACGCTPIVCVCVCVCVFPLLKRFQWLEWRTCCGPRDAAVRPNIHTKPITRLPSARTPPLPGGIVVYDLQTRALKWSQHLDLTTANTTFRAHMFSPPTRADIDRDGRVGLWGAGGGWRTAGSGHTHTHKQNSTPPTHTHQTHI